MHNNCSHVRYTDWCICRKDVIDEPFIARKQWWKTAYNVYSQMLQLILQNADDNGILGNFVAS